jgi:hypothetical protein
MPKQMSSERKIIELENKIVMLRQRNLTLQRKMEKMKADYEKKLKARKDVVVSEDVRGELIEQRDRLQNQRPNK